MQNINSQGSLRDAILLLQQKQDEEGIQLREQFNLTLDSMKPINLIKSTFSEAALSRELKENILSTSVGLAAGFLVKVAIAGLSKNPIRRLAGNLLMYGVTKAVATHPDTVKSIVRGLFNKIGGKNRHTIDNAAPVFPQGRIK